MQMRAEAAKNLVPPERIAEASVWIARLHGGSRSRSLEAGLRRWLTADADNPRAFELATEVWEESERLKRVIPFTVTEPRRPISWFRPLVAATACALALGIGVILHWRNGEYRTEVGEQRTLALKDGTQVFMNTATRLLVHYDKTSRRIELETGEALFNVARNLHWPFLVTAGGQQIRALGTSFVVRRDDKRLAVTLVEGRVTVSPVALVAAHPSSADVTGDPGSLPVTLSPGQRITFSAGAVAKIDAPALDQAVGWRRQQVVLKDTPLEAAAEEMNRYNTVQLIVANSESQTLLINGLFQAGDSASFAEAIAQTYGLAVVNEGDKIVLTGVPKSRR